MNYLLSCLGGGKRNHAEGSGVDLQSLHATSLGEKQRSSEAFCMTLIKWSLQSIAASLSTSTSTSSAAPSATLISVSVASPNPFLSFRPSSSSFSSSTSSSTPTSATASALSSAPHTHPPPSSSPSPPPYSSPSLSVLESCRILTLLLIHRPSLLEQLLSNSLKASPHAHQITPCKSSNKEYDSQNVEISQENVLDTPQQLILMGLAILLPLDGDYSKYELFLSDPNTSSDSALNPSLEVEVEVAEKDRMNRFVSWLHLNRIQV